MNVTDEMVHAACAAYQGSRWAGRPEVMNMANASKHRDAMRAALTAALPSAADEPVAWMDATGEVHRAAFVEFYLQSYPGCDVPTRFNIPLYPRPASARPSAGADAFALLRELIDIEGPQPGTAAWADKVRALLESPVAPAAEGEVTGASLMARNAAWPTIGEVEIAEVIQNHTGCADSDSIYAAHAVLTALASAKGAA